MKSKTNLYLFLLVLTFSFIFLLNSVSADTCEGSYEKVISCSLINCDITGYKNADKSCNQDGLNAGCTTVQFGSNDEGYSYDCQNQNTLNANPTNNVCSAGHEPSSTKSCLYKGYFSYTKPKSVTQNLTQNLPINSCFSFLS